MYTIVCSLLSTMKIWQLSQNRNFLHRHHLSHLGQWDRLESVKVISRRILGEFDSDQPNPKTPSHNLPGGQTFRNGVQLIVQIYLLAKLNSQENSAGCENTQLSGNICETGTFINSAFFKVLPDKDSVFKYGSLLKSRRRQKPKLIFIFSFDPETHHVFVQFAKCICPNCKM